jgi:hypothetical protein
MGWQVYARRTLLVVDLKHIGYACTCLNNLAISQPIEQTGSGLFSRDLNAPTCIVGAQRAGRVGFSKPSFLVPLY